MGTHRAILKAVKYFDWDDAKNAKLRTERGIGFEEIVFHIERGDLLDILEHPNPDRYAGQRIFVVRREDYVYLVPFVEDGSLCKSKIHRATVTKTELHYEGSIGIALLLRLSDILPGETTKAGSFDFSSSRSRRGSRLLSRRRTDARLASCGPSVQAGSNMPNRTDQGCALCVHGCAWLNTGARTGSTLNRSGSCNWLQYRANRRRRVISPEWHRN